MTTVESETRATSVRHLIVAVTVAMSVILYLDRYCVSFAERYIKEDLALSETQMAWFLSAFFWSYALAQVPSGWLSDRLGSRGVLVLYIVSWSFFTAMIGLADGFVMLIVMRLGCGLGQAGAYPTAGSILSLWVPFSNRGRASGLVALGGRLGAVIAPILTAYLMVVFVPLSTPAKLTSKSILDVPALCEKLSRPTKTNSSSTTTALPPIEQRVQAMLPAETREIIAKPGEIYRDYLAARKAYFDAKASHSKSTETGASAGGIEPVKPNWTDAERHALAQGLAQGLDLLLEYDDLFLPEDFAALKSAERQAQQLQQRRLAGERLSNMEMARLNRLFLEGVFPKEIGKLYVNGWRPVLVLYGAVGLLVGGVFWLGYRNAPQEHPWCNAAERALIAGDNPSKPAAEQEPPLPWKAILHSASLWGSSISQFATNVAWVFFVSFFPRYLIEVHQVPILERSLMTAVPALGGIAGMFLGGWLTDMLVRCTGLRLGRAIPMTLTRFFAAGTYLACLWIDSPWPATIAFCLGFFFVDLGVSATWAFMQDVGGKYVGAILGWANMWGNLGAAVAPLLYDFVLGPAPTISAWNVMFIVCACNFVLSGVSALGIDATKPIVAEIEP
jgi:sugar phosphate permease